MKNIQLSQTNGRLIFCDECRYYHVSIWDCPYTKVDWPQNPGIYSA